MEDLELRQLVADTGRLLVEKQLVARTWGNISVRKDDKHFAISPSGLGYDAMTADDVPVFNMEDESYEGKRKPSSEKRIHAAAYKIFDDVNFVIHTHQDYATAVSLVGTEGLVMTPEERELLGQIRVAAYGLPGTKRLKYNIEEAMLKGSQTVLMIHHGALVMGKDRDDAVHRAEVLETVCKRAVESKLSAISIEREELSKEFQTACKSAAVVTNDDILYLASKGGFRCQLDDIAQMIGSKLKAVENDDAAILKALNKQDAVLVKNVGAVILAEDPDDTEALKLLVAKSAMSKRFTEACGKDISLSGFDCNLMKTVYKMKYSKQKGAK